MTSLSLITTYHYDLAEAMNREKTVAKVSVLCNDGDDPRYLPICYVIPHRARRNATRLEQ
jgi:hypothetical protein